jgi:hypothetical protein
MLGQHLNINLIKGHPFHHYYRCYLYGTPYWFLNDLIVIHHASHQYKLEENIIHTFQTHHIANLCHGTGYSKLKSNKPFWVFSKTKNHFGSSKAEYLAQQQLKLETQVFNLA